MIEKGHAEVVPPKELETQNGKKWYIPHHGVHHPKKASPRVVFHCSALFQGTSLNNKLIQGPNLTSNVVGVLLRFRQKSVAFMADVQSMFHQVRVMEKHVNFLKFLWWLIGETVTRVQNDSTLIWCNIFTKLRMFCSQTNCGGL